MKKWTKLLVGLLGFAMLVALIPVVDAQAAKQNKYTLYVGESCTRTVNGIKKITGIKVANKKIVEAKQNDTFAERFTLTALKKGTTTVTVKGLDFYDKEQTAKITVAVMPMDISCEIVKQLENGYVLISVVNNTKQVFGKVSFNYAIRNTEGETVKESSTKAYVSPALPGKPAYYTVFISGEQEIDCEGSTVELAGVERSIDSTYKAATEKQVQMVEKEKEESETGVTINFKKKNTLNKTVSGKAYIEVYNAEDELVGLEETLINLGKNESGACKVTLRYSTYPSLDHWKVVVHAYYTK